MPNFTLAISGAALTTPVWSDPASSNPSAPSRLCGNPLSPPRYRRVQAPGFGASTTITFSAIVAGVTGPSDSSLGGVEFSWAWSEVSNPGAVILVPTPGFSSTVAVTLLGQASLGHYLLSCRRLGGGAVNTHLDVEN